MKRSSEDGNNKSEKKIIHEDDAQPSCSGNQTRKINYGNSDDSGSDSEFEDIELIRRKKMKKSINGEIRGSSLYLRATDNEKGNSFDEFCTELSKKFNSESLKWINFKDLQTLRIAPKLFYEELKNEVHWHWTYSDEHLTYVKMMGIQRILEFEIASRRRSINFEEFIKYMRRSSDDCFQMKWDKWEIEVICNTIILVFDAWAETAANYSSSSNSSSSDDGYVD